MSSTTLTLGTSSLAFFLLGFLLWQLADCGVGCRQAPWDVDLNELYATVLPPPQPLPLNSELCMWFQKNLGSVGGNCIQNVKC